MFTGELLDEIIEQLDETGTTSITEKEFTGGFAALACGTSLDSLRNNVEKFKKKREQKRKKRSSHVHFSMESYESEEDELNNNFNSDYELFNQRTQDLERQLRQAKLQSKKISKRYTSIIKETSIVESISKKHMEKTIMEMKSMEKKMHS